MKITQMQLGRALDLLLLCARKKWNISIQERIANIIAKSQDKEETISQIEGIIQAESETDVLKMLDELEIV